MKSEDISVTWRHLWKIGTFMESENLYGKLFVVMTLWKYIFGKLGYFWIFLNNLSRDVFKHIWCWSLKMVITSRWVCPTLIYVSQCVSSVGQISIKVYEDIHDPQRMNLPWPFIWSQQWAKLRLFKYTGSKLKFCFCSCSLMFLISLFSPQSPSSLPGYVSACSYSPPNQYDVYGGPAAGYISTGHHWQPQSCTPSLTPRLTPRLTPSLTPSLTHPGPAAPQEAADFHSATSSRDGETDLNTCFHDDNLIII